MTYHCSCGSTSRFCSRDITDGTLRLAQHRMGGGKNRTCHREAIRGETSNGISNMPSPRERKIPYKPRQLLRLLKGHCCPSLSRISVFSGENIPVVHPNKYIRLYSNNLRQTRSTIVIAFTKKRTPVTQRLSFGHHCHHTKHTSNRYLP